MNLRQWTVLFVAVALVLLLELFPPWLYEDGRNSAEQSAGHHFVFGSDPQVKSPAEMKHIFSITDESRLLGFSVRKDLGSIYLCRLILLFVPSGLFLVLDDERSLPKLVLGSISLCIGVGFVSLYILYVSARWN